MTLKKKEVEELNVAIKSQTETINLLKEENSILQDENNTLKEENNILKESKMGMELLIKENSMLKANNKKLEEQINVYNDSIKLYQKEIAMKISGQVRPEMDTYFLNFN